MEWCVCRYLRIIQQATRCERATFPRNQTLHQTKNLWWPTKHFPTLFIEHALLSIIIVQYSNLCSTQPRAPEEWTTGSGTITTICIDGLCLLTSKPSGGKKSLALVDDLLSPSSLSLDADELNAAGKQSPVQYCGILNHPQLRP